MLRATSRTWRSLTESAHRDRRRRIRRPGTSDNNHVVRGARRVTSTCKPLNQSSAAVFGPRWWWPPRAWSSWVRRCQAPCWPISHQHSDDRRFPAARDYRPPYPSTARRRQNRPIKRLHHIRGDHQPIRRCHGLARGAVANGHGHGRGSGAGRASKVTTAAQVTAGERVIIQGGTSADGKTFNARRVHVLHTGGAIQHATHLVGTITTAATTNGVTTLTVKLTDGTTQSVTVSSSTRIRPQGKTAADLTPGER